MSARITAEITADGKRVIAKIPYAGGQGKVWAKKVPGCTAVWDKTGEKDVFVGWGYPLSMETCWKFRQVFGADLTVAPALSAWAREELSRRDKLEVFRNEDAASAADALGFVQTRCPDMFLALSSRPYQLSGAAFGATAQNYLLGDEPGLGKTIQTLAVLVQRGFKRILVSCPRTATRTVWEREIGRWAPHMQVFVAQGSRAQREAVFAEFAAADAKPFNGGHPRVLVINTEMMRASRIWECHLTADECYDWVKVEGKRNMVPWLKQSDGSFKTGWPTSRHAPGSKLGCQKDHKHEILSDPDWPWLHEQTWDSIVVDESHNSLASRYNVQSKHITQVRFGAMKLRARIREGGAAISLSGTPARSKLEKFWGQLNWTDPKAFSSFWRFVETHFETNQDGWGKVIGTENEHGRRVAVPLDQELFDKALRPYYLVRDKATAAPDLPPIQYAGTPAIEGGMNCVWVDMEDKQAKAYREMAKMATARVSGGTCLANGTLAEITRLRQLANAYGHMTSANVMVPIAPSAKIDWIIQFLLERQDINGKYIIASSFTEMVELTAEAIRAEKDLGYEVKTLTGATSDKNRTMLQNRFQNPDDGLRVVVINSKAGGEAITLDAADDVIAIDLPWTSDEWSQLENRAHRVSRVHQVTVHRLASVGTLDEWMATLTDEQREAVLSARPEKQAQMAKEAAK